MLIVMIRFPELELQQLRCLDEIVECALVCGSRLGLKGFEIQVIPNAYEPVASL